MKKLLIVALTVFSAASFARVCYVDLVDQWSRYRYDTFTGYTYNNVCRDGLRECHRAKRERGLVSAECVQRGIRGPGRPGPRPPVPPRPVPGPGRYSHLLHLSDWSLAEEAERGRVGSCRVVDGPLFSVCSYYVRVNGRGYPQGLGCSDRDYTYRYGCKSYSDKENAGCLVRKAILQGSCR